MTQNLPQWPQRTVAVLSSVDEGVHAIPVSAIAEEPMAADPEYVAVAIEVAHVDDHRQPAFRVTAGIGREWVDDAAKTQLSARVHALTTEMGA